MTKFSNNVLLCRSVRSRGDEKSLEFDKNPFFLNYSINMYHLFKGIIWLLGDDF